MSKLSTFSLSKSIVLKNRVSKKPGQRAIGSNIRVNCSLTRFFVMLIEMPGVTIFYDQLKALGLIDLETPVPPPHVTMYTQNCPLGIDVPNDEILNTLSRKTLSVNALNKLCE